MKLHDKVAVITGGNSGIGLAIAEEFNIEGARLVIFGRNRQTLDEAQKYFGDSALTIQGDVSNIPDLDNLYQNTIRKFGKIDIIVVNAAIGGLALIEQTDEKHFDDLVRVNFKGAYFTIQKALPHLNVGASIILIASSAHKMGIAGLSVYTAIKAALRSLARTLSAELMHREIRVNVISPGPIKTKILDTLDNDSQAQEYVQKMVPIKRFGSPKEVATVAVFLASSDSSYILGEDIAVDGGQNNLICNPFGLSF